MAAKIAPELRERAIMHMMPPYSWSLRQVANECAIRTIDRNNPARNKTTKQQNGRT